MKLLTDSICKIGGRDYNQDFVAESVHPDASCFVVCDGLGSYAGSEEASRLCARQIIADFDATRRSDPQRAVKRAYLESYIENAHRHVTIYKEQHPQIAKSCTTVACVVTNGVTTHCAHIGDTRIYFFKNGSLAYQSKDHSLSQLAVDAGKLALRDIRTHKDQNKLMRVLGSDYYSPPHIETISAPLEPGDAFLLCSDGLWEYVYEEEMAEDILSGLEPRAVIERMEKRLSARIEQHNDNYSALLALVTGN